MSLSRDTLFIIKAPFEDRALEGTWFCTSCATMEGALLANPHWANRIDVKRSEHPRPRREQQQRHQPQQAQQQRLAQA